MTEIGAALGPEWRENAAGQWVHPLNLQVLPQDEGLVVLRDWAEEWTCATLGAAVAVAVLLVAAERLAAGAEVGEHRGRKPFGTVVGVGGANRQMVRAGGPEGPLMHAAAARRGALDLLAAADEADRLAEQ